MTLASPLELLAQLHDSRYAGPHMVKMHYRKVTVSEALSSHTKDVTLEFRGAIMISFWCPNQP